MPRTFASLVLSCVCLGCAADPNDPPSVAGKPADEQADIVTDVACEYVARCGLVGVACPDCDGEDCGGCVVEVETITYDECVADMQPEYEAQFSCGPLTEHEVELVDDCLSALVDWDCPDPQALEAWANGELEGDRPDRLPASCEAAQEIGESCDEETPGGDEGMMPSPG